MWTIFTILLSLWLMGYVTGFTLGGFIHVLLIVATVAGLVQIVQDSRAPHHLEH